SNIDAKGQVKVDNQIWSARSEDGSQIAEGTKVNVLRIEGVKLIVSAAE
ncbi:MAG: NfeD family protein, partial [Eubacterium sp.]|nr:NfeD family protein [Eubacterium sp.]